MFSAVNTLFSFGNDPIMSLEVGASAWQMLSLIIHNQVFYCELMGLLLIRMAPVSNNIPQS